MASVLHARSGVHTGARAQSPTRALVSLLYPPLPGHLTFFTSQDGPRSPSLLKMKM